MEQRFLYQSLPPGPRGRPGSPKSQKPQVFHLLSPPYRPSQRALLDPATYRKAGRNLGSVNVRTGPVTGGAGLENGPAPVHRHVRVPPRPGLG